MLQTSTNKKYRVIVLLAAGVVLLATLASIAVIWSLRVDAIDDAVADAHNIATVLTEQADASVQAIEIVMHDLQERIDSLNINSSEDFRHALGSESVHAFLKDRLIRLPQALAIDYVDHDGNIVNFTRMWPIPPVNLADREYFQYARSHNDASIHISAPIATKQTNVLTIYFTKRISNPTGDFLGIAMVGVGLDYFRSIYGAITPWQDQSFLFLRSDGTVLVRFPDSNPRSGARLPLTSPWYQQVAKGGGYYRSPGIFDGKVRLVAVHPLKHYPLVINVAVSEDAALKRWRSRATIIGVAAGAALLCIAVLLLSLSSQFRSLISSEGTLAKRSQELDDIKQFLDSIIRCIPIAVAVKDAVTLHYLLVNQAYETLLDLPSGAVIGKTSDDIFEPAVANTIDSADREALLHENSDWQELTMHTSNRGRRTQISRRIVIRDAKGEARYLIIVFEDVTERRKAENRIAYLAHHDLLTGLANRAALVDAIEEAASRSDPAPFSVLLLDLDRFKQVNDTLGHPAGDILLKQVAARLKSFLPPTDTLARLGGDEFAIIQRGGSDQRLAAGTLAGAIIEILEKPFDVEGNEITIGASIGIALAPEQAESSDELLKMADLALYWMKAGGRNGYRFFDPEMSEVATIRHEIEANLRHAIEHDELVLHYQPIIEARSGKIIGAEALVRWQHPTKGLIPPDHFIPLAEETGLISRIGEWVLRTACAEAATWPQNLRISVNLSPLQFRKPNLPDQVMAILAETGLPPSRLELEITETALIDSADASLPILRRFKTAGITIALDDFGTGYSSLSQLASFPFDKIKIDKSFTQNMTKRSACAAIISATLSLANSLGMETTAEGVETEDQYRLLRLAGVTSLQGYLFAPPAPASELDLTQIYNRPGIGTAA